MKKKHLTTQKTALTQRKYSGKKLDNLNKYDICVCCRTQKEYYVMLLLIVPFQHYLRKTKFNTSEKNITKLLNFSKEALSDVYPPRKKQRRKHATL